MGSVIEILILQALTQQIQNNIPDALIPLKRALALAEPGNYFRIFLDEGVEMAQLLHETKKLGILPRYTGRLLAAYEAGQQRKIKESPPSASTDSQHLIEPLSERELQVLRLFRSELSGPEIARELTVSLNTLRTHTKNIYSKLGVNNRRAAVRRAEEFNLL
jgi:LuxR family maltose regulon positive regulatory protein